MLRGEKILITGPAGRIAFPLARRLAADNEVWGIARFGDAAARADVEALGVTTRSVDLATGDLGDLPTDFDVVLHLAADLGPADYERALTVNAEGTGLLLAHCRRARAVLVMSTLSVYRPHPDPWHAFREDDPLGDAGLPGQAPYSVSKIGEEAVARTCARLFDLPVTIARMGAAYGERGGLPLQHLEAVAAGRPVVTRSDPMPYTPIHDEDIADQVGPLVEAASVPATIVNWTGDEVVTVAQWTALFGELLGVPARVEVVPVPGASLGSVGHTVRRRALTGPCRVPWAEGLRREVARRHPGSGATDLGGRPG